MQRRDFYFRQGLKENELDTAFDGAEQGLWNLAKDLGLYGIASGGEVVADTGASECTVKAFVAYDKAGRRLYLQSDLVVDYTNDTVGNPTVPSAGNYRWITIVARFGRNVSDARTDGAGAPVKFVQDEALVSTGDSNPANVGKLQVLRGVEDAVAADAVRPSAGANDVIIADLLLSDTGIALDDDVSQTRADRLAARFAGALQKTTDFDGTVTGSIYSKVAEFNADGDFSRKVRFYLTNYGAFVITTNARWDGEAGLWVPDSAAGFGLKLVLGQGSALKLERRTTTSGSWTDQEHNAAGWDGKFEISQGFTDGFCQIDGRGEILGNGVTTALFGMEGAKVAGTTYWGHFVTFRRKLLAAPSSVTFSTISGAVDLNVASGPYAGGLLHEEGAFIDFIPNTPGAFVIARKLTTVV